MPVRGFTLFSANAHPDQRTLRNVVSVGTNPPPGRLVMRGCGSAEGEASHEGQSLNRARSCARRTGNTEGRPKFQRNGRAAAGHSLRLACPRRCPRAFRPRHGSTPSPAEPAVRATCVIVSGSSGRTLCANFGFGALGSIQVTRTEHGFEPYPSIVPDVAMPYTT